MGRINDFSVILIRDGHYVAVWLHSKKYMYSFSIMEQNVNQYIGDIWPVIKGRKLAKKGMVYLVGAKQSHHCPICRDVY